MPRNSKGQFTARKNPGKAKRALRLSNRKHFHSVEQIQAKAMRQYKKELTAEYAASRRRRRERMKAL
jgi:hypothetical protein